MHLSRAKPMQSSWLMWAHELAMRRGGLGEIQLDELWTADAWTVFCRGGLGETPISKPAHIFSLARAPAPSSAHGARSTGHSDTRRDKTRWHMASESVPARRRSRQGKILVEYWLNAWFTNVHNDMLKLNCPVTCRTAAAYM